MIIGTILIVVQYSLVGVVLLGAAGGLITSMDDAKKRKIKQAEARENYIQRDYEDCDKRFFEGRSLSKKFTK